MINVSYNCLKSMSRIYLLETTPINSKEEIRKSRYIMSNKFLLFCTGLSIASAIYILKPFINAFIIAAVITMVFYPVYNWLMSKTNGKKHISSLITCTLIFLFIIIPVLIIFFLLANEGITFYTSIHEKLQVEKLNIIYQKTVILIKKIYPSLNINDTVNLLKKLLTNSLQSFGNIVMTITSNILKVTTSFAWDFFLVFFILYYLFINGKDFLLWLMHISPLSTEHEKLIFEKFKDVSIAAFYGCFLTALIQGILGGISFFICGLPAILWGSVMAFFSLVPLVGTAIVWFPAAIYLFIIGKNGLAIFMIAWGILIVGMADNILKPILMKGKLQLHPMLVFLSILGGIYATGFIGIILGPLIISLCIVFFEVYESVYADFLSEKDNQ